MVSEKDLKFLEQRKKLGRYWPVVGIIMLLIMIALAIYLFFTSPALINPYYVMDRLDTSQLDFNTMHLLAVMCPLFTILLFSGVLILIFCVWSWMNVEKRYLRIINELKQKKM